MFQNRSDIIKIDGILDPTVDYIRLGKYIFFGLGVKLGKTDLLTLSFRFIYKNGDWAKSKIGTVWMIEECVGNLEDSMLYMEILQNSFKIKYASMKVSFYEESISKEIGKYKSPLGLVSFYSNPDYEDIPNNLANLDYFHSDSGRILVLKDVDVFEDDSDLKVVVLKSLKIMKEIGSVFPGYCR